MSFSDVVNELKLHRTSVLESRVESAEDFKVQLAQMDMQNNILSDIRRSVVAMAGIMDASNSRLAEALTEQNRLAEDAASRAKLASEGKDKEKVVEAKLERDQEPKEVGGLLGKLLGLLKGLVVGGVAAVLGSELWLTLRGLADGSEFDRLAKKVQGFAAGTLVFAAGIGKLTKAIKAGGIVALTQLNAGVARLGAAAGAGLKSVGNGIKGITGISALFAKFPKTMGVLGKAFGAIAAPITTAVKAVGPLVRTLASVAKPFFALARGFAPMLRVVPGIGQAIMFLTAAFDGIKAGFEKFREGGNAFEIALAVVQGALMSIVDGFVALGEMLFNLLPEEWQNGIEAAWGVFKDAFDGLVDMIMGIADWIGRKINQVGDLIGTSEAERARDKKQQEVNRLALSKSGHRGRRLSAEERARVQADLERAQAELLELKRAAAEEDNREYVPPSERNSRARNMSERADRVKQMERQSMVVAPVIATDASVSNTNVSSTNTMVSGALRPEYDGVTAY